MIEKKELNTTLEVHKKKADSFYKLLHNEFDGEITFSFDCQKNLVLPKVPITPDNFTYIILQFAKVHQNQNN